MAVHVTPHKNGWQVKTGGATKAHRVVDTQSARVASATPPPAARRTKTTVMTILNTCEAT